MIVTCYTFKFSKSATDNSSNVAFSSIDVKFDHEKVVTENLDNINYSIEKEK